MNDDTNNTVRQALFGSGTQDGKQLVQNVWIGSNSANPYLGINAVLDKLGFVSANGLHHGQEVTHETHFHIDLRAPVRKELPQNLQTEYTDRISAFVTDSLMTRAQMMLEQAKANLNLSEGEVIMYIPDTPNVPPQNVPVMIAQANQAQLGDMKTTRAVGICSLIPNGAFATPPTENRVHPIVEAFSYLYSYESQLYNQTNPDRDTAIMTVLQSPKHGSLTEGGGGIYVYLPEKGYFGNDSATVLVSVGGIKVKVIYFFQSIDVASVGEGLQDALCENGYKWKISSTLDANGNSTITSIEYQSPTTSDTGTTTTDTATLASTLGTTLLSNLAGEATGVTVNLADLPGAAECMGSGLAIAHHQVLHCLNGTAPQN